jgi:hypothetical protein
VGFDISYPFITRQKQSEDSGLERSSSLFVQTSMALVNGQFRDRGPIFGPLGCTRRPELVPVVTKEKRARFIKLDSLHSLYILYLLYPFVSAVLRLAPERNCNGFPLYITRNMLRASTRPQSAHQEFPFPSSELSSPCSSLSKGILYLLKSDVYCGCEPRINEASP